MTKTTYEVSSYTANSVVRFLTLTVACRSAERTMPDEDCWDASVYKITTETHSCNKIIRLCYALIRHNTDIRVVYWGDGRGVYGYDARDYLAHLAHGDPLPDGYTPWADCKPLIIVDKKED